MTRTDYINRVKKGIEVYEAMEALKDSENLSIMYGKRGPFNINCSIYSDNHKVFSINDTKYFGKSMNIDMEKSGKSYLECFTFDLFGKQTIAKLYFEHITFIENVKASL
jgi:hypothetical protein